MQCVPGFWPSKAARLLSWISFVWIQLLTELISYWMQSRQGAAALLILHMIMHFACIWLFYISLYAHCTVCAKFLKLKKICRSMSFWIRGYIMVCCNVIVAKKEIHRKSKPIEWLWSVIRSNTNAKSNFRLSCLKKSSRSSGWRWTACSCKYPTKCIWMETIRIKPVPSVPGSFFSWLVTFFCPTQPP